MLQELHALGKAVRAGQDQSPHAELVPSWEELVKDHRPKAKKGKPPPEVRYRWQPVEFDLDERVIRLPVSEGLREDPETYWNVGLVKMDARRGLKHFPAVRFPKHFKQFWDSFVSEAYDDGDLLRWADKRGTPADEALTYAARAVAELLAEFRFEDHENDGEARSLEDALKAKSASTEPICAIYATVTDAGRGWNRTPLGRIGNFQALHEPDPDAPSEESLCYFTNERRADVGIPASKVRYNLNKVFVTETVNYASGFDRKAYQDAFRINEEATLNLEEGSNYLLNGGRLKVEVAGSPHVVVPAVLSPAGAEPFDETFIDDIQDIHLTLFSLSERKQLLEKLEESVDDDRPLSLTYLAFASDGNSTKITSSIRDVGRHQFQRIRAALRGCNGFFGRALGKYGANLYTFYTHSPVPKDSDKKPALSLITAMLEGRAISAQFIYQSAMESLLVHRYGRYPKYDFPKVAFVKGGDDDSALYFSQKNVITQFLILRRVLLELGQYDHPTAAPSINASTMETPKISPDAGRPSRDQQLADFFAFNNYSPRMQGCFYLGRAINRVAYEQQKRGNAKNIIERIDYSGMDAGKLLSLSCAIAEKASLYRLDETTDKGVKKYLLDKVDYYLRRFNENFDQSNWHLPREGENGETEPALLPQEASFYVLSGYVFRFEREETDEQNDSDATPDAAE